MMVDRVKKGIVELIRWTGDNPNREGLKDTPERVMCAFEEMTKGYLWSEEHIADMMHTTFSQKYSGEMVVLKNIDFTSLCEHHLLPFSGVVSVAYIPENNMMVGISKLARLVDAYSKRLQIQERMTEQIAAAMEKHLQPKGVAVVVKALHSCRPRS